MVTCLIIVSTKCARLCLRIFSVKFGAILHKCPVFALSFAVILCILTSSSGAPTDNSNEWWLDPCQTKFRHYRAADTHQFNTLLIRFKYDFKKQLKDIYMKTPGNLMNCTTNKVAKRQCLKANKLVKFVSESASLSKTNEHFYITMVEVAKYLEYYSGIHVKTESDVEDKLESRRRLLKSVKDNLMLFMCEFQSEKKIDNSILKKYAHRSLVKTSCLPKAFNLSTVQMSDIDMFCKLHKYFKRSNNVLKKHKRRGPRKMNRRKNRTKQNKL